jgi:hypothetical protein
MCIDSATKGILASPRPSLDIVETTWSRMIYASFSLVVIEVRVEGNTIATSFEGKSLASLWYFCSIPYSRNSTSDLDTILLVINQLSFEIGKKLAFLS